ncbi:hypothetical protein BHE74_00015966 [Ensete ventricosum]|nr:hypothetical protein BHE74_00015966 [Ensete ventricosum]
MPEQSWRSTPSEKNKLKIAFEAGETEYFDHNDALVVSVSISNARVKRVMIDIGSYADVLYFDTLQKLGLTTTDLSPMSSTLTVSTGGSIAPLGMTILLVTIRQEPKSKTMMGSEKQILGVQAMLHDGDHNAKEIEDRCSTLKKIEQPQLPPVGP